MLNWFVVLILALLFVFTVFMVGLYIGYIDGYKNGKAIGRAISNEYDVRKW